MNNPTIETTIHPHMGEIRKTALNEGFLTFYVKKNRMVYINQWGEASYPMMTSENFKQWQLLVKG